MANIKTYLNNIKTAVFGSEVRDSIHDAIQQCYDDASAKDNANMEVKMARGEYENLGKRLDSHSSQIKDYDDKKINRNEQNSISMGMLTTEVKESLTGGSVAVVGTDSVGFTQFTKEIQDDIYELKDISPQSYNTNDAYISNNKVVIGGSVNYKHQIFNVSEGERYNITINCLNNPNINYVIYCDDDLNVTGSDITGIDTIGEQSKTLLVPKNTTKMYINVYQNGSIVIEKYSYSSLAIKKEVNQVAEKVENIDNVIKTLVESDVTKYDYSFENVNGIATQSSSVWLKSIVGSCVNKDKVYVTLQTNKNPNVKYIHFIKDDFTIVSTLITGLSEIITFTDYELEVPNGATKIIINYAKDFEYPSLKTSEYIKMASGYDVDLLKNRMYKIENNIVDIPSYYDSYLENKIKQIKDLELSYGSEGETFIFITDLHLDANSKKSPILIQKIINETNCKNIICGGDLIPAFNQTEEGIKNLAYEYMKLFSNIAGSKLYTISGNHDLLGWSGANIESDVIYINDDIRYSILYKDMEDKVEFGDLKQNYFYFDNKSQKIRYICLGMYNVDQLSEEEQNKQITWLNTTVLSGLDGEWTIFIFGHNGLTSVTGDGMVNTQFFIMLKNAINNIKSTYNVAFYMNGHLHKDLSTVESGITHISTACDALYSDNGISRVNGTITEQCFDVVCVNKKLKTINCVRIGAGNDREFTY